MATSASNTFLDQESIFNTDDVDGETFLKMELKTLVSILFGIQVMKPSLSVLLPEVGLPLSGANYGQLTGRTERAVLDWD